MGRVNYERVSGEADGESVGRVLESVRRLRSERKREREGMERENGEGERRDINGGGGVS